MVLPLGVAATAQSGPALTAYVDTDSVRRFGIEAEGRWLEFNQVNNVHTEPSAKLPIERPRRL